MTIYWPLIGKKYEVKLSTALQLSGNQVVKYSGTDNFIECLISLYAELCSNLMTEKTYIIIDIDHVELLNVIIRLSSTFDGRLQRPLRLIVISTLLTWSGCWSVEGRSDLSKLFFGRKPVPCAMESYALENRLWESALTLSYLRLSLISFGLFHGENGWDFEKYFMDFWLEGLNSMSPNLSLPRFLHNEETCPPIIHISDFVKIVSGALSSQHDSRLPIFYPAADMRDGRTLDALPGNARSLPPHDTANIATEDRMELLWSSAFPHSGQSRQLGSYSYKSLVESYNEFRCSKGLTPFKVLVVGGPCSGKSAISREIALRYQVPVVTASDALLFVATSPIVPANDPTRASLFAAIEARSVEKDGKKGAKKDHAAFSVRELDLASYDYSSEAFLAFIAPSQIVRKCVAVMVLLSPIMQQKGFILDLWRHETFDSPDSILKTMRGPSEEAEHIIVIEVRVTAAEANQRFLETVGVAADDSKGKLTKDQQAALKAFESTAEAYAAKLAAAPQVLRDESHSGTSCNSHPHVIELSQRGGCSVVRQHYSGSLKEDVMPQLESKLRSVRGTVGWLDSLPTSESSAAAAPADAQPSRDDGDDGWNFARPAGDQQGEAQESSASIGIGGEDMESFARINAELSHLPSDVKSMLIENCTQHQAYLVTNVLPVVAKGLVEVNRQRPDDPLRYMIDYLEEQADRLEATAESQAREKFYAILAAAAAASASE